MNKQNYLLKVFLSNQEPDFTSRCEKFTTPNCTPVQLQIYPLVVTIYSLIPTTAHKESIPLHSCALTKMQVKIESQVSESIYFAALSVRGSLLLGNLFPAIICTRISFKNGPDILSNVPVKVILAKQTIHNITFYTLAQTYNSVENRHFLRHNTLLFLFFFFYNQLKERYQDCYPSTSYYFYLIFRLDCTYSHPKPEEGHFVPESFSNFSPKYTIAK